MSVGLLQPAERLTLGALRYAVNDEVGTYLAVMRLFTAGVSGFLSDQSADEITDRLHQLGVELDRAVGRHGLRPWLMGADDYEAGLTPGGPTLVGTPVQPSGVHGAARLTVVRAQATCVIRSASPLVQVTPARATARAAATADAPSVPTTTSGAHATLSAAPERGPGPGPQLRHQQEGASEVPCPARPQPVSGFRTRRAGNHEKSRSADHRASTP